VYNPVLLEHHKLGMIDIVACSWHSVGLTRRGQVYTWGLDQSKTLGIPNIKETHVNEPTLVLDAGIERIFGGHYAMGCYAVSRDGTVYVWGRDNQQRFGVANQPQAPTKVEGLSGLPILDICVLLDYSVVHIGYKPSGQRVKRVNKFADVIIAAKL
jgi:alpha-tubulin suppressor-like RCC1 family protein